MHLCHQVGTSIAKRFSELVLTVGVLGVEFAPCHPKETTTKQ
jgi:hypothetical protein